MKTNPLNQNSIRISLTWLLSFEYELFRNCNLRKILYYFYHQFGHFWTIYDFFELCVWPCLFWATLPLAWQTWNGLHEAWQMSNANGESFLFTLFFAIIKSCCKFRIYHILKVYCIHNARVSGTVGTEMPFSGGPHDQQWFYLRIM